MEKDLRITHIELRDFRNYERFELDDVRNLTIFVGSNGVGKTNVLESIQLLCACTSFKHPTSEEVIRHGADAARASISCESASRKIDISLSVAPHKKNYQLNGKNKTSIELKGTLPAVMFCPDDLELAKKSSSVKRAAIDDLGSQITRNYHVIQRDYEKVIRYKNQLLKDEAALGLIESINDTLVTCGAQLIVYRLALFEKLIASMRRNYASIAGAEEPFSATYAPSWTDAAFDGSSPSPFTRDEVREMLHVKLSSVLEEERARHRSLVGPHADHIDFFLGEKNVSAYASQGQQRSVVLAFKLAEVEVIKDALQQNPVLLLDDVMSELDESRRRALVDLVQQDIQTFITTTNLSYFDEDLLCRAAVVNLPLDSREGEGR